MSSLFTIKRRQFLSGAAATAAIAVLHPFSANASANQGLEENLNA